MNAAREVDSPAEVAQPSPSRDYDALLLVSFGGPEGPEDVIPFLENVLRGRNVPRERMLEVAEHYELFGGVSPINAQNRALLAALVAELNAHGPPLAVYWGNRNWHPLLPDTLQQMADDGIRRALAFVTSAFASYSGCRQYREDLEKARLAVGPDAPEIHKLRLFYNHPGFIEPMAERVAAALAQLDESRRSEARIIYTAHSLPEAMARNCAYEAQIREAARLVSDRLRWSHWEVAYQSRSGPPAQPWLEPDVARRLRELSEAGQTEPVVLVPIGFLSEHMEVIYDLDVEAAELCRQLGIEMVRSAVVGTHPRFVQMIRELVEERLAPEPARLALGDFGPSHDFCPVDCCLPGSGSKP